MALSAVAVLAAVAFVVMGKGGQLARFEADHPPLDLPDDQMVTSGDVHRVMLPLALWGYHVRAVDEVLRRVAEELADRDARIADLEQRLAEARGHRPLAAFGEISRNGSGPWPVPPESAWDAPRDH